MGVLVAVGAAVLGVGTWAATPLVSMARTGTIDQQTKAAMREEGLRAEALRRARHREALVAAIPAPRVDGDQQQRSPISA